MSRFKNYAIVGGGFSGLAIAYALFQQKESIEVTLFDPNGFGGEASKISTGLLHKYVGQSGKQNPFGESGEQATKSAISAAEMALGRKLILSHTLLRIPNNRDQEASFFKSAEKHSDLEWLSPEQVKAIHPSLPEKQGLRIHSGLTLDVNGYLEGLSLLVQNKGLKLEQKEIGSLSELDRFDKIFIATGAKPLLDLKVAQVKGQLLVINYPEKLPPLPCSVIGPVYVTMSPDQKAAIVGATYEHHYNQTEADLEFAKNSLIPKLKGFLPELCQQPILSVRAGIRASTPSKIPFAGKINERVYALVGMGSRGLLYHIYFAQELVKNL